MTQISPKWTHTDLAALRWRMYEILCRLYAEHQRPITRQEIIDELGFPLKYHYFAKLKELGLARIIQARGFKAGGLVPLEHSPTAQLLQAVQVLRKLPVGRYPYLAPKAGAHQQDSSEAILIVDGLYKRRLCSLVHRAKRVLKVRSLRDLTTERLPDLLQAVYTLKMEDSGLPPALWESQQPEARRARKTALNRRSEVQRFLDWASHHGYLDLRPLRAPAMRHLVPSEWAAWLQIPSNQDRDADRGLVLARLATQHHIRSPARFAEIGFREIESLITSSPKFEAEILAHRAVSACRRSWNQRAEAAGLPLWDSPRMQRRTAGRTLPLGWWSAHCFVAGKPTLLDEPGMELQKREARDIRDWWTLRNPKTRPAEQGGPLPPRPARSPRGGLRIGARSEKEGTATRPLATISYLQRFVLSADEPEYRLSETAVAQMSWSELLLDLPRVLRFINYAMRMSADTHDGVLVRTSTVIAAEYIPTLAAAYFPAWVQEKIRVLNRKSMTLRETEEDLVAKREIERQKLLLLDEQSQWSEITEAVVAEYSRLEAEFGGQMGVKAKDAICDELTHTDIARIADWYRSEREALEARAWKATRTALANHEAARSRRCEDCGVPWCDVHLPSPTISSRGMLLEALNRDTCYLAMCEGWLRLLPLVPWRPSVFCRARIGEHLDPNTLELAIVGNDGKVARDVRGKIRRQEMRLFDLEAPAFMPQDVTEKAVQIVRIILEEAQPWLASHPTKPVRESGVDGRLFLFLNYQGGPCKENMISTFMQTVLERGARGVNGRLKTGEAPIRLPEGWGARGSYIYRLLYGHSAVKAGVPLSTVALALGNTEATVRRAYHRVAPNHALNSVARATHATVSAATRPEGSPGPSVLTVLANAKAEFDRLARELCLSSAEAEELWRHDKARILKELGIR